MKILKHFGDLILRLVNTFEGLFFSFFQESKLDAFEYFSTPAHSVYKPSRDVKNTVSVVRTLTRAGGGVLCVFITALQPIIQCCCPSIPAAHRDTCVLTEYTEAGCLGNPRFPMAQLSA